MTLSIEPTATVPVNPGLVAASRMDNDTLRMPATELPEVVRGGTIFSSAATSKQDGICEDPFKLDSKFAYTPRKIKVFTIGAGFSGLLMAHKFQHRFPEMRDIVEHTIFEAHSEVGGTWFVNNYPGVQCDVPAHIYVGIPVGMAMGMC